ncbi:MULTISPECIES: helix-turn-helix transcriptional regulator [unclassified Streptomyces]|uniref:helix-turn-helix domain-containing protein n=1 Tax=unclassified Streptomyces TaxID=2593676 RepID=UPI000DBA939F|nr:MULTISPECIES: helix-turn-helix transcriptional regulator [unclassified Streptomyces]MYT68283.1 helix-turn-helix domain-containing protein [Streptomyces sp. SID8367]RAJ76918.1 helix-turn-helix protein [Streptomyces sp. PsTaAH-137]
MPQSPSSSAQAAREAVASRLRNLRKTAGLTVAEHSSRCGWSGAKTSRIENALTAPSARDIRRWCEASTATDQADGLITQSVNAEAMYTEWRQHVRNGLKELQQVTGRLFTESRLFRVYSSTLVPGLLQTMGYAAGVLHISARTQGLEVDDSPSAAHARVDRSRILYEQGRRFLFVIEEAALYYQLGDPAAMAAQLGHLLSAGALPGVALGIIPSATAERRQWPRETFHVYDDRLVSVELVTARVRIKQQSEIDQYVKVFAELRSMAVYGADARALITRAIDTLDRPETLTPDTR